MHLSFSSASLFLLGLAGISSAAPAPNDAVSVIPGLPPTCYLKDDLALATRTCYTHTTTTTVTPKDCPPIKCPTSTRPIYCPMVIHITSVPVPCSTDCCPVTPTKTSTVWKCPGCTTTCVIPTETVTYTTGCTKTPTGPVVTMPPRVSAGPVPTNPPLAAPTPTAG